VKSLVTGAAGFIGANLVRRLVDDGDDVIAVTPDSESRARLADVVDRIALWPPTELAELVRRERVDRLFHLASHGAYSWQTERRRIYETNLLGTIDVVDAAAAAGVRAIVVAGSSSEYGRTGHPPAEDERLRPESDYAIAKAAATMFCEQAVERGVPVTTLRLYSVYGPFEDSRRLVPQLLSAALGGRLPPLADPETAHDFVYVDDAVDAFVVASEAAARAKVGTFNVGTGVQTTLAEIVELARDVFDVVEEPSWGGYAGRSWDSPVWVADPSRAQEVLGWRSQTALRDGLTRTAQWMREERRPELVPARPRP
jgi:nucleoside-diphosphate-sugar epimerase